MTSFQNRVLRRSWPKSVRNVPPVGDADLRDVIRDSLQRVGVNASSDDRLKSSLALALIFHSIIRFVVDRFKKFGIVSAGPGLTELVIDTVMDACLCARHRHALLRSSQAMRIIADCLRVHHGGQGRHSSKNA